MKKLFISQPMNGKTEEEILAVRKKAIESAEVVLNEDVEVIKIIRLKKNIIQIFV